MKRFRVTLRQGVGIRGGEQTVQARATPYLQLQLQGSEHTGRHLARLQDGPAATVGQEMCH